MTGLEPLVAVSLAGNILQFVHGTRKLIETTRELFDNGAKTEHLELEAIARDLRTRVDEISIPQVLAEHDQITDNQNAFETLARQCRQVTGELLAVLEAFKQHGNSNRFTSFAQALRTLWREPQIEALRRRLNAIAQAVQTRLGEKSAASLQTQFDRLFEQNREMEISRAADIEKCYQSFSAALQNSQEQRKQSDHFDEEMLATQMNNVALESMHYSVEQKLLRQLRFPRIEDRYSSISPAHEKTLNWLFGDTSPATFAHWLDSDNDLYWISGLPGSGKSTLMKFLCTHALTLSHLARWAEDDQVIVAEYFFWNAGKNDLQKSQEGLLRSLLYQILRKCPSYIRRVFPGPWSLYNGPDDTVDMMADVSVEVPSDVSGLKKALRCTCAMLAECNQRFCFFIDGLDEYKGKPMEIVDLIDVLRALKHVKICVSSRPWEDFEDAYGSAKMSKLLTERFNDRDIIAYVEDKFAKDRKYQESKDVETRGEALVKDIVTSANGVFLWVILVVQSLQEGLRKGDGIKRLEDRLHSLPSDLEELLERILFQHVDPVDCGRAARMFLVTLRAIENLPLMAYWFLDEAEVPAKREPFRMQVTTYRHRQVDLKLKSCCKGLLQSRSMSGNRPSLPSSILFDERVDFLHRTVRDYLSLPSAESRMELPPNFNADEAICRCLFAQIKTAPHGREYSSHVISLYDIFRFHAEAITDNESLRDLKNEANDIVREYGITFSTEHTSVVDGAADPRTGAESRSGNNIDSETTLKRSSTSSVPGKQTSKLAGVYQKMFKGKPADVAGVTTR